MEHFALNLQLLNLIYAGTHPNPSVLLVAKFAAKYLIWVFPLVLIYQAYVQRKQRAFLICLAISMGLALVLSYIIGHYFAVARPFVDGYTTAYVHHSADAAFPSDHAILTASIAFTFILARYFTVGWLLLLTALIIGWARIYVGIHYPLDVFGGWVLGFIVAFISIKGLLPHIDNTLL